MISNTPCLPKHRSTIVLLHNKCILCISCHCLTIKTLTLRMDHAKLLDVLTSLTVSRSILSRAVYFATARQASHAICSFIDSSGYASGPIRRCLFIDYIIKTVIASFIHHLKSAMDTTFMSAFDASKVNILT